MSSWSQRILSTQPETALQLDVRVSTTNFENTGDDRRNEDDDEGDDEEEDDFLSDRKMLDFRSGECLERIVPSTTTALEEKDLLAEAVSISKLLTSDEQSSNLNMDDDVVRRRFLCQPWSSLRDCFERFKPNCDTGSDECGAKTKEQKKVAVLPHAKYPLYGYCPSRDEYVVVKCKLCGTAVKPVAHRAHMHSRHNIGLKSPEPTTPVASVISPAFPSSSSSSLNVAAPSSSSNVETIPLAHDIASAILVEKDLSKEIKKTTTTNVVSKSSIVVVDPNSAAMTKDEKQLAADNYVVVAPHSADRPLKLTFRRERSNLGQLTTSGIAANAVPLSGHQQIRERKKPTTSAVSSTTTTTTPSIIAKNRVRQQQNNVEAPTLATEKFQQQNRQSTPITTTKTEEKIAEASWNHQIAPSTSLTNAATVDPTPSTIPKPSTQSSAATTTTTATVVSFTPATMLVNGNNYQNHVYEHPRPLASCRFEQRPPPPAQTVSSSLKLDYGGQACYLLSSYTYNSHRRWPTFRRSTQTIRQACRKIISDDDDDDDDKNNNNGLLLSNSCRQNTTAHIFNGSKERPKPFNIAETEANKWMLNNGGSGQHRRLYSNDHKTPSQFTILRAPTINRLANNLKNGQQQQQSTPSPIIPGSKYQHHANNASINKSYTKVNINQLKAAAVETGQAQLALDLGTLLCNGDSNFQHKPIGPVVGAAAVANQKRAAVKRPSSTNVLPSTLISASGHETVVTGVAKKPRLHQIMRNNGQRIMEFEDVGSIGMSGTMISNVGLKPAMTTSYSPAQARQQLVKALQQAHNPNNNGNRRKPPPPHGIRHQLTPIVISPSQTPQPSSSSQPQSSPQVVLVSVNGPQLLAAGWHKLTTSADQSQQQQQQQTGYFQNGLSTTAAIETATTVGARIIRPKMSSTVSNMTAVPVYVTHSDHQPQHQQYHRQSQSLLTQRLTTTAQMGNGGGQMHSMKQMSQARFCRRANSSMDDLYPITQQHQSPLAQFRPIKPAQQQHQHQQQNFGHCGGLLRSSSLSSTPVLAGPIVFNVSTVAKGGGTTVVSSATPGVGSMGQFLGQQSSRQ